MSHADVRKNFVFEKEVATHLEEIAKIDGKSMTAVVRDMIEARYKDNKFFGLSALGMNPHVTQKVDKIIPNRIEDPFLWLLYKSGILKTKG